MEYHNPRQEPPGLTGFELACAMVGWAALCVGVVVILARILVYDWQ